MGSVTSHIECPNCNDPEMYSEDYYKTGEQYQFCNKCGYAFSLWLKRNEEGEPVKDVNDEFVWEETHIDKPIAAVSMLKDGSGQGGSIASEEDLNVLRSDVNRLIAENPGVEITINRFVDGKHTSEVYNENHLFSV